MSWIYAHLIGDYIIQNDWMASGKKKNSFICFIHVVTYLIPFLFCGLSVLQLSLIGAQHFAQDRTNFVTWFMKVKGSENFSKTPMSPWSVIITDNIIHILFIAFVVEFIK